ncbi:hypothetical protein C5S35_01950 [Candidatus Methanophagaceae archaeon]|nr:hypothetical protein C5S35_01950 [Methanophagales archaeon]
MNEFFLKKIKGLKMKPTELLHPEQRRTSKAYLVRELRKAVCTWQEQGYPHTTDSIPTCCSSGLWETISVTMRLSNSGYFSITYTKVDKNRNYGA